MLGRSTRKDDGIRRCERGRDGHHGHLHNVRHGRNQGRRNGRAMHMRHGLSLGMLTIAVARRGVAVVMMLMGDMVGITMRVGVDLDPRDAGHCQPQRQCHDRKNAHRLAKPAVQPYAEESQVHDNSMPQFAVVLNEQPTDWLYPSTDALALLHRWPAMSLRRTTGRPGIERVVDDKAAPENVLIVRREVPKPHGDGQQPG